MEAWGHFRNIDYDENYLMIPLLTYLKLQTTEIYIP